MAPDSPAPPLSAEEILAHAVWLRRLAVGLVGGGEGADDLVQEAWLASVREPPRRDQERPLAPWLVGVVRNLRRLMVRGEARRRHREAEVGQPEDGSAGTATPETLLHRMETQRLVANLVVSLEEPFRSTVLLRYFEDLSAAEIARIHRVPAGTVRWRLKTGLDRLRRALDERSGGDRRSWRLALLPLTSPSGSPVAQAIKGALAMSQKIKLGGAAAMFVLALVATGGAYLALRDSDRPAQISTRAAPAPAGELGVPALTTPKAVENPGPDRPSASLALVPSRVERDLAAAGGAFEGRVVNGSTGAPVAGARVTFAFEGATVSVPTDAEGRFNLEPERQGIHSLALVTAAGYLPFAPQLGHSPITFVGRPGLRVRDITLFLSPAIDYHGVVLDPAGKPVSGARVSLLEAEAGEQALSPLASSFTTDAQGAFVFHAPDDAVLEARQAGFSAGRARLDGAAQVSHRLVIRLGANDAKAAKAGEGDARISGRVVDPAGAPIADALVWTAETRGPPATVRPLRQAISDDDGRFVLEGLDAGSYDLLARAEGRSPARMPGVSAGQRNLKISLALGGGIAGRAINRDGSAVSSFSVIVRGDTGLRATVAVSRAVVDPDGHFQIDELVPGAYRISAAAHGLAPSKEVTVEVPAPPARGGPVELTLAGGGTVWGSVVSGKAKKPLPYAKVTLEGAATAGTATPIVASAITAADGTFRLAGFPAGPRSVLVGAFGHHPRVLSGIQVEEGGSTGPLTVVLEPLEKGEPPVLDVVGIGVKIAPADEALLIEGIVPGGGAADAQLGPGDTILAVDGIPVVTLGMEAAIQRIRGPEGSTITVTVKKSGAGAPVQVTITRRRLKT